MLATLVSVTQDAPLPSRKADAAGVSPTYALKFSIALTLFGAGMHYLVTGRKEANWNRMLVGAALALASLFFL